VQAWALLGALIVWALGLAELRSSMHSGLRGYFAIALGAVFVAVFLVFYAWQGTWTAETRAAGGFLVSGWLLITGGMLQMPLHHSEEYQRFRRETNVLDRLIGRGPRVAPTFRIDFSWLMYGLVGVAVAVLLAALKPGLFILAWFSTVTGGFMILASAGGFSPEKPRLERRHREG